MIWSQKDKGSALLKKDKLPKQLNKNLAENLCWTDFKVLSKATVFKKAEKADSDFADFFI